MKNTISTPPKTYEQIAFDSLERNAKRVNRFVRWDKTKILESEGARETDPFRLHFLRNESESRSYAFDSLPEMTLPDDSPAPKHERSGEKITVEKIREFWRAQGIDL